jgi:hypothetical protein
VPFWRSFIQAPPPTKKNGQSNRKRNSSMTNFECRLTNVECRIKEFRLFYLLKRAERSDIHHSSIIIRHSMKFHTRGCNHLKLITFQHITRIAGFHPLGVAAPTAMKAESLYDVPNRVLQPGTLNVEPLNPGFSHPGKVLPDQKMLRSLPPCPFWQSCRGP